MATQRKRRRRVAAAAVQAARMMSSVVGHEEAKAAAGNEGLLVPNDLIVEILSKIPASSLLRFKQVCKHWFNLITSDSSFINMNLHHSMKHYPYILMKGDRRIDHSSDYLITLYSLNCWSSSKNHNINDHALSVVPTLEQSYVAKSTVFVGHCNGLLCILTPQSNFCVWNPCTKEFKELPHPLAIYINHPINVSHAYGFGYDCTINDYKVIVTEGLISYTGDYIHYGDRDQDGRVITRVCTLGAGGRSTENKNKKMKNWKIVKRRDSSYMFRIASMLPRDSCGFFFNGGLYWMEKPDIGSVIICFDISKEEYKEISIPQCYEDDHFYWLLKFDEFKGSLCILKYHMHVKEDDLIEAWMMKDDYSWTKLFTINGSLTGVGGSVHDIIIKTSICNDNGEIIIIEVGAVGKLDNMSMLWYNPECPSNTNMSIKEIGFRPSLQMYACTESLVSLNSGTYMAENKKQRRRGRSNKEENNKSNKKWKESNFFFCKHGKYLID